LDSVQLDCKKVMFLKILKILETDCGS